MSMISAIIPYTRPDSVHAAAASALAQSIAVEVVVVDNAASVPFAPLPGVVVHTLQRRVSPGIARAAGVAVARSDWLAFLDDDDEWLPTYCESQLAVAQSASASIVIGHFSYRFAGNGRVLLAAPTSDRIPSASPMSCVAMRRDVYSRVGPMCVACERRGCPWIARAHEAGIVIARNREALVLRAVGRADHVSGIGRRAQ